VYAASFALVVVALITLVVGVFQSGLTFIWISIGSSVLAAVFLAAGVLQKKPVQPATAGAPYGPSPSEPEAVSVSRPEPARAGTAVEEATEVLPATVPEAEEERMEREPAATRPARGGRKQAAKKKAATRPKKAPAKTAPKAAPKAAPAKAAAGGKKAAAGGSQVVAIPERGTYHQAGCRFVKGRRDTEKITKQTASRRGYSPCGVCRP
jgi:hypothetical protein